MWNIWEQVLFPHVPSPFAPKLCRGLFPVHSVPPSSCVVAAPVKWHRRKKRIAATIDTSVQAPPNPRPFSTFAFKAESSGIQPTFSSPLCCSGDLEHHSSHGYSSSSSSGAPGSAGSGAHPPSGSAPPSWAGGRGGRFGSSVEDTGGGGGGFRGQGAAGRYRPGPPGYQQDRWVNHSVVACGDTHEENGAEKRMLEEKAIEPSVDQ